MKVLVFFAFAFVALAAADRDWSNIFRKHLNVAPISGRIIPQQPSTRITGGSESVPHSRPWQVALRIEQSDGLIYFCSGSLIDEQNVLTTAYCLSDVIGDIEVVLGAHNIREAEATQVVVYSSDYLYHEQWDDIWIRNDIGLIRLPSPVALNENIQPIPVDDSWCGDDYVGREASVSGWGMESDSATSISSVLREVTAPVIDNDECASWYGNSIQPTSICTDTTGGKSPCGGDSGAPLVLGGVQIGIYSFSSRWGCQIGYPGAFTRVCKYHRWIAIHKKQ